MSNSCNNIPLKSELSIWKGLFALLAIISFDVFGQSDSSNHSSKKFLGISPLSDTISDEKNGVFVLPLLYYTPDTRWAAGAAGVYYLFKSSMILASFIRLKGFKSIAPGQ